MTQIKQRAVGAEQRQQRIQQILTATQRRFEQQDFHAIRLIDIAADVGITKAALYRYFRNKEVLFLALYEQNLEVMVSNVKENLNQMPFLDALAKGVADAPMYCKLTCILHTVLESNLTVEEAITFKRELAAQLADKMTLMSQFLSATPEQTTQLFLMMHHCVIGAWANCSHGEVIAQALETPELSMFKVDFSTVIRIHIQQIFGEFIL
ncbi:TetR family transcriptional regulator [Thalassotalea euphylliae]|uniref:TetR family transcriptional regulator n=1 Tax=Thalassotalea euphylliae TaxID=1655234 RepID=UPI00362642BC